MKKLIVALCSLALSCAGTFGINQLVTNEGLNIDKNIQQVITQEDAEETQDTANLPEDTQETERNEDTEDKASEVEAAAPTAENAERDDTKELRNSNTKKKEKNVNDTGNKAKTGSTKSNVNNTVSSKKTGNGNAASNIGKTNTVNKNTASNTNNNTNTVNNTTTANKSGKTTTYIYKNIDLSDCYSVNDVVEKLQDNGYSNINANNINNISSLNDILSSLGQKSNNNTQKTTTTTPKDTTATNQNSTSKPKETGTISKNTNSSNTSANTTTSNSYAEEVLRLVNVERSKAGLAPLTTNTTLKAAADKRAQETSVSFSHTRPNGSKFSTVLQEYGISYRTAGENIAYGQRSPQEVVNAWMNSSGHRANILNGNFNKIGIGVYQANGVIYWSQLFTN